MSENKFTREEVSKAIANAAEIQEKPDWTGYIYNRVLAVARDVTDKNPHVFTERVPNQRIHWSGEEISLILFALIEDASDKRGPRFYRYRRLGVTQDSLRAALSSLLSGETTTEKIK